MTYDDTVVRDASVSGGLYGSGVAGSSGFAPVGSTSGPISAAGHATSSGSVTLQPAELKEREVAFTLITSTSEPGTRDAVRRLLLNLSNAADDGDISSAQIQIKVIASTSAAAQLEQDIRDTGDPKLVAAAPAGRIGCSRLRRFSRSLSDERRGRCLRIALPAPSYLCSADFDTCPPVLRARNVVNARSTTLQAVS